MNETKFKYNLGDVVCFVCKATIVFGRVIAREEKTRSYTVRTPECVHACFESELYHGDVGYEITDAVWHATDFLKRMV